VHLTIKRLYRTLKPKKIHKMKKLFLFACVLVLVISSCSMKTIRLFTGSYTKTGDDGFTIYDMNLKDGSLKKVSSSNAGPNPSYFCISKKHGYIYAANEVSRFLGKKGGGVTTVSYDKKSGTVKKVHEMIVPNGGPAFISLSADENFLLFANYGGGSVAVVKLDEKGIPAGVADTVKFEPVNGKVSHVHMVSPGPGGKYIYATDLGLDRIMIFTLGNDGRLKQIPNGPAKLAPGAGPRHFTFSSDGKKMYVINELNSTLSVFDVNADGSIKEVQTLPTLAENFSGKNSCADIHISKGDKYLYGSNRGENTIVVFRIENDGKLTLAGRTTCGGDIPRNFVIEPSGRYLLVGNQKSSNISVFAIDRETGIPQEPGKNYNLLPPVCLKFTDNILP
jgi:6-phosphogluconolactonase